MKKAELKKMTKKELVALCLKKDKDFDELEGDWTDQLFELKGLQEESKTKSDISGLMAQIPAIMDNMVLIQKNQVLMIQSLRGDTEEIWHDDLS